MKIKHKFVKDNNFPIQVLDSPYFEYFLDLYEPVLGTKTSWKNLQREIQEDHNGKPEEWIRYSGEIQNRIVNDIVSSEAYQKFNTSKELADLFSTTPEEFKKDLYSGANKGKKFMSIDLREANFQAFHWVDPEIIQGKETWEEFVGLYSPSKSLSTSKALRQILLGKTNPKRVFGVQRHLIWKITDLISGVLPPEFTLFSRMTDEVIYEIPEDYVISEGLEENIRNLVKESLKVEVKIEVFTLKVLQRFTHSGVSVLGFIKDFTWPEGEKSELKGVPKTYFSQMYKAWKGLDLNPTYDLVFSFEGELARFDYPLSIVNINEKTKNNS